MVMVCFATRHRVVASYYAGGICRSLDSAVGMRAACVLSVCCAWRITSSAVARTVATAWDAVVRCVRTCLTFVLQDGSLRNMKSGLPRVLVLLTWPQTFSRLFSLLRSARSAVIVCSSRSSLAATAAARGAPRGPLRGAASAAALFFDCAITCLCLCIL